MYLSPAQSDGASKVAVADLWWHRLYRAQETRSVYSWRWAELLKYYMNDIETIPPPGMGWMHTEMRQDAFDLVEGFIPHLAKMTFHRNQAPIVETYTPEGEGAQLAISQALLLAKRKAAFEKKSSDALRMLAITGHITQLNYWHREYGHYQVPMFSDPVFDANGQQISKGRIVGHEPQEVLLHNGPNTEYPDQRFIWKSQEVDWKGDPLWWIEMFALDLDMAREVNREYYQDTGEYLYDDLESLERFAGKDMYSMRGSGVAPFQMEKSLASVSSWRDDSLLLGDREVLMLRCSGFVPPSTKEYDDVQWRQQVIGPDSSVHRDAPYPSKDYRPTYRDVRLIQIGKEPYGRTPLEFTIPAIEARSELRNLKLADIWMNVMPQFIAKRNIGWDQGDFLKLPFGVWMYDDDETKPNEAIMPLERQPVLSEAYMEDQAWADQLTETMGSNPNMRGNNYGQRTSAYEANNIENKSGSRMEYTVKGVSWQMEQRADEDYYGLMGTFMEDTFDVPVEGQIVPIHASDLQYNVDISIDTGDFGPMNSVEIQGMQELINMVSINGEWAMQIDPRKTIKEYAHRLGVARIMRNETEVTQIMNQMAVQQQQMQAAQLAAGANQALPAA